MFRLFKKKQETKEIILHLNMPLQPIHRHNLEDHLQKVLKKEKLGNIEGGGTLLNEQQDEIESCDIQIILTSQKEDYIERLVKIINAIGVAKGSELICSDSDQHIPVGTLEGLAYYNNGTDLPQDIYDNNDINTLIEEMLSALNGAGVLYSFWESEKWTILYFFGDSFEEMQQRLKPIITKNPFCQKSKLKRWS